MIDFLKNLLVNVGAWLAGVLQGVEMQRVKDFERELEAKEKEAQDWSNRARDDDEFERRLLDAAKRKDNS